jgi:DNA-directed RNA polymerase subunit RPC12/RpoP
MSSVVNAKAFVCAGCQKMITYGPHQAGAQIVCPRCGDKAILPQAEGQPPLPLAVHARKKRRFASCLFAGCGGCLVVLLLLVAAAVVGAFKAFSLKLPSQLQSVCEPLISHGLLSATAPASATYASSDISIAVTRIAKECPLIYQASLRQSAATETPVYCVTVTISNGGESPVFYRTWRDLADAGDAGQAATLLDGGGGLLGVVSFGPGTWPLGAQQHAQIPPGSSVKDVLLFQCGTDPAGDFLITLPGANLGRSGALRFRIPRAMLQQADQQQGASSVPFQ